MPGPETFVGQRRTALFDEQRPRLTGLAYRMLGGLSAAELVLDDASCRWTEAARSAAPEPELALTTLVCRLAMDRLRGLRREREGYAGAWLPEPVCGEPLGGELPTLELLVALEALSPLERAAYVLRVSLGRPYAEVATVLGRRQPAVRQLVRRARRRLGPMSAPPDRGPDHPVMLARLADACRSATLPALAGLLAPDVVLVSDEGPGAVRPRRVVGREPAARSIVAVLRRLPRGAVTDVEAVNGATGVVLRVEGSPVAVLSVREDQRLLASVLLIAGARRLTAVGRGVPPTAMARPRP